MANSTDVRQWAREQGREIGSHGRIPAAIQQDYDAEHPADPGPDDYPAQPDAPDYDGGVSDDDFVTADDPPGAAAEPAPGGPQDDAEEQAPRSVARGRRKRGDFRQRLWSGGGDKPKRPAKKHARVSLKGVAEDLFLDLAWTVQGLPPLEKILYLQAPLAGTVVEDAIKGTALDKVAQPVARADRQFKALEALTAPAWVAVIMAKGRKDPKSGEYSPETKLMFSGLRHSLLSMSRLVDGFDFEQQKEKAEELRTASGQIDKIIAYLFEMPEMTEEQARAMYDAQAARSQGNGR